MQIDLKSALAHGLLAAGLAFGAVAAQAAGGFSVTHAQEMGVKAGLSADEVRQLLGRPAHVERFLGEPGPVWTYNVSGGPIPLASFEIGFGADGKVASFTETEMEVE